VHGDHVIFGSVHDQHRNVGRERRRIGLVESAAHHDDSCELLLGAIAGVERHQASLRETAEDDLAGRRGIAGEDLVDESQKRLARADERFAGGREAVEPGVAECEPGSGLERLRRVRKYETIIVVD